MRLEKSVGSLSFVRNAWSLDRPFEWGMIRCYKFCLRERLLFVANTMDFRPMPIQALAVMSGAGCASDMESGNEFGDYLMIHCLPFRLEDSK